MYNATVLEYFVSIYDVKFLTEVTILKSSKKKKIGKQNFFCMARLDKNINKEMKIVKTVIKLHWKISEKQTDVFLKYLEGIKGAAEYKQAIVAQWGHHSQSGQIADQMYLTDTGVIIDHLKKTKQKCFSVYLNKGPLMSSSILESHIYIHTSGGSMIRSATIIPSCSSISRKAMTNCAQADIKRGFFVQIFFLLPARMRAMRLV